MKTFMKTIFVPIVKFWAYSGGLHFLIYSMIGTFDSLWYIVSGVLALILEEFERRSK